MKRLFIILLSLSALGHTHAQTVLKKKYFDEAKTKLKEVITVNKTDSTLHGPYQSFYQNGSLEAKGFYTNSKPDSLWAFYFENGHEKAAGKYRDGIQSGKWSYYFENGNIKAEGIFDKNIKHGHWTFYFENGKEKSSGIYFDGKKEGIWNYLYEEGSLKAQAYYDQGDGIYKEFYPSGSLKMEGRNIDEESEGAWIYYYETGEKEADGNFKNGLRHGYWKFYHKNGQVAAEGNFNTGEKSGVWKYYYPDGSVSSEGEMKHDQKDGFWKLYYQSGIVKGEGKYDQGTGDYMEFYENGKQKSRGSLKDGKKHGTWVFYNEKGEEDGVAEYEDGVGDFQSFYPDGTLKMEGQLEEDRRVGEWTLYNPDGTVAGVYRPVYENEKPIFRTSESIRAEIAKRDSPDKPEYRYKTNKLRYFIPRPGEFRGYIIGTNPFYTIDNKWPVALEYYIQERLGHEIELTIHRNPFFSSADINEPQTIGGDLTFRQKFYHNDKKLGMFYFGHQLSGGYLLHKVIKLDSSSSALDPFEVELEANESRFAYGVFIGNRWMQRVGNAGLTVDFHIGVSIGSRSFNKEYAASQVNEDLFKSISQGRLYTPMILGLNIGFSGPKRPSPSF